MRFKYHKKCNTTVEFGPNIYSAWDGESIEIGYLCRKCRCFLNDEDIGEFSLLGAKAVKIESIDNAQV